MGGPVPRIEIRLFGTPEVRVAGRPIELSRGRVQALLTVLALSAGRPIAADTLAERVWAVDGPADPRGSIYTTVSRLRQLLGPDAISSAGGSYLLFADPADVDVLRFEQLLDEADQQDGEAALASLRSALATWRDEPFGQQLPGWITQVERPRLIERYLAAIERRVDLEIGSRPADDLVDELAELTRRHPLRESVWLRLMRVLAEAGRIAEALAAYEAVRALLAHELGVDPGADLRRLHSRLLAGQEPDRCAEAEVPRQLPAGVAAFVGRSDVLRQLDELYGGAGPLVVIHGAGGVGKTALAVQWAERRRDDFTGGQLWVDLRGFGPGEPVEPADALLTLLRGLGVPSELIPIDVQARAGLLRTYLAGRPTLVVLDNARDADQVLQLLPGAGATVLVTSRNQLRGLDPRERPTRITLDVLAAAEAHDLLAERLGALGVHFDDLTVTELAALCGHLPLALSVAAERAGRYPGSPLRELVDQLRAERLDLLETGEDPATSLRAVMSWSYRDLAADEARLFRLLGAQPLAVLGPAAAASLVADTAENAGALLDRLVDWNLVVQPARGRYAMHDLVRMYAAERSAADDAAEVRAASIRRLDNWYVRTAANARNALKTASTMVDIGEGESAVDALEFADHQAALAWFGEERDALFTLVGASASAGRHSTASLLARLLYRYLDITRSITEMIALSELGAAAALASGDRVAEAMALNQLGVGYRQAGRSAEGVAPLETARDIYREAGRREGEYRVMVDLANAYSDTGRLDDAIRVVESQLDLARELGQSHNLNIARNNLGVMYKDAGRLVEAARVARQAVDGYRAADEQVNLSMALDTLGTVYLAQDEHDAAAKCLEEALGIVQGIGNLWGEAVIRRNLGTARAKAGQHAEARDHCQVALDIIDEHHLLDSSELRRSDLVEMLSMLDRSRG